MTPNSMNGTRIKRKDPYLIVHAILPQGFAGKDIQLAPSGRFGEYGAINSDLNTYEIDHG
jgi:hypothetical protein